jgi:hypothetical protein
MLTKDIVPTRGNIKEVAVSFAEGALGSDMQCGGFLSFEPPKAMPCMGEEAMFVC